MGRALKECLASTCSATEKIRTISPSLLIPILIETASSRRRSIGLLESCVTVKNRPCGLPDSIAVSVDMCRRIGARERHDPCRPVNGDSGAGPAPDHGADGSGMTMSADHAFAHEPGAMARAERRQTEPLMRRSATDLGFHLWLGGVGDIGRSVCVDWRQFW